MYIVYEERYVVPPESSAEIDCLCDCDHGIVLY